MNPVLLFVLSFGLGACGLYPKNPSVGLAVTGVKAATKPRDEIMAEVETKPRSFEAASDRECELEARTYWFMTNTPGLAELHRFNLYLHGLAHEHRSDLVKSEPEYIGRCVLNPYRLQADPVRAPAPPDDPSTQRSNGP